MEQVAILLLVVATATAISPMHSSKPRQMRNEEYELYSYHFLSKVVCKLAYGQKKQMSAAEWAADGICENQTIMRYQRSQTNEQELNHRY